MIETLVSGKENSSFVVIKDSLTAPGANLLLCWTRQSSQRSDVVVVTLHCGTDELNGHETFAIDCLRDLQCDKDPSPLSSILTQIQSHPLFPSPGTSSNSSVFFVLSDLNSLFLFFPSSCVFRFCDSLLRLHSSSSILGLLHRDCFPTSLMPSLDYLIRTSITLHPPPPHLSSSSSIDNPLSLLTDVFHKKPSGKVIRSRQLIRLGANPPCLLSAVDVAKLNVKEDQKMEVNQVEIASPPSQAAPKPKIAYEDSSSTTASSDPTANLTFNLNLSAREKVARERVVLPFAKKSSAGQGRIFYEAEDEDDLDEEDPDDDLNI